MRYLKLICTLAGVTITHAALAGTTTTYSYDALGRLTKSETAGTVNNGAKVEMAYDPADNRTSYKVTGSKAKAVVVVPLNGFTVIPLNDN